MPEDDEWEGFESDSEAEANQKGHKSDNRTGHRILEDIHSATDTPGGSTSLGRGLSRSLSRLGAFDERDLVSWVDLNNTLDPRFRLGSNHHILGLSNMIRRMDKAAYSTDEPRYKYAEFISKIRAQNIGEWILASIESNLRGLIETGRLSFDTVNQCKKSKARTCHRLGIYVHVMYALYDDNRVGMYFGSSLCIGARIKEHERNLAAVRKRGKQTSRYFSYPLLGSTTRNPEFLVDFWTTQMSRRRQYGGGSIAPQLNGDVFHASFPDITPSDLTEVYSARIQIEPLFVDWPEYCQPTRAMAPRTGFLFDQEAALLLPKISIRQECVV